ncbi:acyl-CoA N-acyltransferase [Anaeromyces robustus]|uniref:Acyl-CoA N-acyltransferase n=1 Tax=Anaeromyces robustus TaxID=1754192 RepID=A0A1Y1XI15_9FUNG|nr:acyl-CoA N-acyltransferase [Anaeromyces robustus]|eukprot:ORX85342.1 acyl-CoA N-acyltransferase [Anaeromyces robustus]
MASMRRFVADDIFTFNNVNLDPLTETYNLKFYFSYLVRWPDYCAISESPSGTKMGYIIGKAEGKDKLWHGHVTAVTVAPEYRHIGLATRMMKLLEEVSEKVYNTYFVDLFVRVSNAVAIGMYKKFGYSVYRQIRNYYMGPNEEDAYDMRKALPRDVNKESIIPVGRIVEADELEWS